jgi:hypothetical protein
MSVISTAGARIDRWDNGRPAHREQAPLIEAVKLERSSRYLCSGAYITFISKPHDDDAALILAPYMSQITIAAENDKNGVIALREIAARTISPSDVREGLIHSMQHNPEVDESESTAVPTLPGRSGRFFGATKNQPIPLST